MDVKDIIKESNSTKTLLNLPNSPMYQLPSEKLKELLADDAKEFVDLSNGLVTINRFCESKEHIAFLGTVLEEKFVDEYPDIEIEHLEVFPQTPLPSDFTEMKFLKVRISDSSLRKDNGTFSAYFQKGDGYKKNIYFRYSIKAVVPVFKAKHNLSNGKILTSNDYERVVVSLEKLPAGLLQRITPGNLVIKQYIKEGALLSKRQFREKLLVPKNSFIIAIIRDGALSLQIEAEALSGGNKGDTIRIKTNEGKTFRAVVLSENKVVIKE